MKRATIAGLALAIASAGCANEAPRPFKSMTLTEREGCGAVIEGRAALLDTIDFDAAIQRAIPDKTSTISFGQPMVSHACAARMIKALGKLGYRGRVGFISEPPTTGAR